MKNILLVGGAGYIGSVTTQCLLNKGFRVTVLDNFIYGNNTSVLNFLDEENYTFVYGDMRDDKICKAALRDKDIVIILGGLVGDPITKKYPELSKDINVDGVLNFINKVDNFNIEKLIFVSTCSNYGLLPEGVIADEQTPLKPLSSYAQAKVLIEEKILAKSKFWDLSATILRFATAFGLSPRMRFDLTVNEFTYEAWLGNGLEVYDPDTWRPYCHVLDFVRMFETIINTDQSNVRGKVFNVGTDDNNFTKRMIVELIRNELPDFNYSLKLHGSDPRNYKVNFSRVRTELNFEPKHSVSFGIKTILSACRQNVFSGVNNNKNNFGNYFIDGF